MGRRELGANILMLRRGERITLEPPGGLVPLKPQHRAADTASRIHQAWRATHLCLLCAATCFVSVATWCRFSAAPMK
eukprot:scaffold7574_cov68-Phaeocystis_antarctica.AAC.2